MKLETICPLTTNSSSELFLFKGKSEKDLEGIISSLKARFWKEEIGYVESIFEIKNQSDLIEFLMDECYDLTDLQWNSYGQVIGLDTNGIHSLTNTGDTPIDVIKEPWVQEVIGLDKIVYPITIVRADRYHSITRYLRDLADLNESI